MNDKKKPSEMLDTKELLTRQLQLVSNNRWIEQRWDARQPDRL